MKIIFLEILLKSFIYFFCKSVPVTSVGKPATFRAGAGGRGGQISNFQRARAGAGAKFQNFCGRGRVRGPEIFLRAGAGGGPARKAPQGHPRAPARVFFFKIISEARSNDESVCKKLFLINHQFRSYLS